MIQIRQYQDGDVNAVKQLHQEGLSQYGVFLDEPELDVDLDQISVVYGHQHGGEFLVAILEGTIVAMGALKRVSATTGEIKRMRVALQYQRQGIGQQILDQLTERAQLFGYTTLVLDTAVAQRSAQRFYERNGFILVKRGLLFGLETLFYEKPLQSS